MKYNMHNARISDSYQAGCIHNSLVTRVVRLLYAHERLRSESSCFCFRNRSIEIWVKHSIPPLALTVRTGENLRPLFLFSIEAGVVFDAMALGL